MHDLGVAESCLCHVYLEATSDDIKRTLFVSFSRWRIKHGTVKF